MLTLLERAMEKNGPKEADSEEWWALLRLSRELRKRATSACTGSAKGCG
jgi:hypothetical protein